MINQKQGIEFPAFSLSSLSTSRLSDGMSHQILTKGRSTKKQLVYALHQQKLKNRPSSESRFWFALKLVEIVLVLELFNTSASVSEFLLSCKERMAR